MKASGVHLGMSVLVFAYLAYQIYYHWYPEPYFSIDGGWQGIRLIGAVDLVLGPLITFLIFDLTKKRREIVFDLTIILVIQFSALTGGIYLTYTQRPLAIVLIDEFMISAVGEHYAGTLESVADLQKYSDEKPPIIYADLPLDREGLAEANRIKLETRVLEHAQMWLYRPQTEYKAALQARQIIYMQRLDETNSRARYDTWLAHNKKSPEEVLVGLFRGRYGSAWLVFDPQGKYLTYF